jgi:hypothetical protein
VSARAQAIWWQLSQSLRPKHTPWRNNVTACAGHGCAASQIEASQGLTAGIVQGQGSLRGDIAPDCHTFVCASICKLKERAKQSFCAGNANATWRPVRSAALRLRAHCRSRSAGTSVGCELRWRRSGAAFLASQGLQHPRRRPRSARLSQRRMHAHVVSVALRQRQCAQDGRSRRSQRDAWWWQMQPAQSLLKRPLKGIP